MIPRLDGANVSWNVDEIDLDDDYSNMAFLIEEYEKIPMDNRRFQLRHLAVRVQENLEKDEVNYAIEKGSLSLLIVFYANIT
ncbi:MAG: hypothetical protein RPR97_09810 [Colwellia sp.]